MLIPNLGFLSLLSCVLLASFSSFIRCATPTKFPGQVPINADDIYGWKGPGVYRITNLLSKLNVDVKADGSVINLQYPNDSNSQRWLIADVGNGQVIILNNGTGRFISATTNRGIIQEYTGSPYDPRVRWKIDFKAWANTPGSPVLFNNTAFSGNVLDNFNSEIRPGTKIIVWPLNDPKSANQAWLLEYLE